MPAETIPSTWESFRAQAVARLRLDRIAPPGHPSRLGYLALGLCGEAGECVVGTDGTLAEFVGEAESGVDAAWKAPPRMSWQRASGQLMLSACAVAECVKRPVQGRDLHREALALALSGVATGLQAVLRAVGRTVDDATRANVEKNHARFGSEGYSAERQREHDAALKAVASHG